MHTPTKQTNIQSNLISILIYLWSNVVVWNCVSIWMEWREYENNRCVMSRKCRENRMERIHVFDVWAPAWPTEGNSVGMLVASVCVWSSVRVRICQPKCRNTCKGDSGVGKRHTIEMVARKTAHTVSEIIFFISIYLFSFSLERRSAVRLATR